MITGFNTDVDYRGKTFHVQTEDKGLDNPIIESLIYIGGEILGAVRTPYTDLFPPGEYDEKKIIQRMEDQHREVMGDAKRGVFDKSGGNILDPEPSDESLDQVILNYLATKEDQQ